ncbi:hypothetical protein JOB18_009738, partial [Solea senegalensis]
YVCHLLLCCCAVVTSHCGHSGPEDKDEVPSGPEVTVPLDTTAQTSQAENGIKMAAKTHHRLKELSTRSVGCCKYKLGISSAGVDPSEAVTPTGRKPLDFSKVGTESAVSRGL